jgi:hypothetical protein
LKRELHGRYEKNQEAGSARLADADLSGNFYSRRISSFPILDLTFACGGANRQTLTCEGDLPLALQQMVNQAYTPPHTTRSSGCGLSVYLGLSQLKITPDKLAKYK